MNKVFIDFGMNTKGQINWNDCLLFSINIDYNLFVKTYLQQNHLYKLANLYQAYYWQSPGPANVIR